MQFLGLFVRQTFSMHIKKNYQKEEILRNLPGIIQETTVLLTSENRKNLFHFVIHCYNLCYIYKSKNYFFRSRNLTVKMLQLCESLCGFKVAQQRQIIHDGLLQVPLGKHIIFITIVIL